MAVERLTGSLSSSSTKSCLLTDLREPVELEEAVEEAKFEG